MEKDGINEWNWCEHLRANGFIHAVPNARAESAVIFQARQSDQFVLRLKRPIIEAVCLECWKKQTGSDVRNIANALLQSYEPFPDLVNYEDRVLGNGTVAG